MNTFSEYGVQWVSNVWTGAAVESNNDSSSFWVRWSGLVLRMLVMRGSFGKSLPTKGITHYTPDICNAIKQGSCSAFIAERHSARWQPFGIRSDAYIVTTTTKPTSTSSDLFGCRGDKYLLDWISEFTITVRQEGSKMGAHPRELRTHHSCCRLQKTGKQDLQFFSVRHILRRNTLGT